MGGLVDGIRQALEVILHGDHEVGRLVLRTLRVGVESTALAALFGLPAGVALGTSRFRGRGAALALSNAGLRVPPVALGTVLWLLMWPGSRWGGGPLSGLHWIYTFNAVILAQTLLVLPVVVALTAAAVQSVPAALLEQARAFGASGLRWRLLALREARLGVVAAIIAALGSATASVGAILVVGSTVTDATLATAALNAWSTGGQDARAVAYGTVLLGLFLILAAALTIAQQRRLTWIPNRAS